jgi:hypothetical protein
VLLQFDIVCLAEFSYIASRAGSYGKIIYLQESAPLAMAVSYEKSKFKEC